MPSIKPNDYRKTASNAKNIDTVIRMNPKQFVDDLQRVIAANTLVNMSKRKRSRSRSRGKTHKRKPKRRRKTRNGRK